MLSLKSAPEVARDLAARIRARRLRRGWTQAETARRAGIKTPTYVLFERTGRISLLRLLKVLELLDLMEEFDRIVGIDRIALFHINDSKNFRGAAKDRHAPVGSGLIGFHALKYIVHHEAARDKPVILETPWIGKEKNQERPMYEAEIALLSDRVEDRFGGEFLEDVERLDHFFKKQDIHPSDSVHEIWESLQDKKKKKEDKREPLERLYDLVEENRIFPELTEEQRNHRLIAWFARG